MKENFDFTENVIETVLAVTYNRKPFNYDAYILLGKDGVVVEKDVRLTFPGKQKKNVVSATDPEEVYAKEINDRILPMLSGHAPIRAIIVVDGMDKISARLSR